MHNDIGMFNGMVYGVKVSKYGMENGYLDCRSLSKIVGDCILNNQLRAATQDYGCGEWELVSGYNNDNDIYQEYIITEGGYKFLERYTDEIVYYNEELDVYLWCVTHFGTSWDYVLTDIKLVTE